MARLKAYARRELARAVAQEAGLNLKTASLAVDAVVAGIQSELAAGERVVLRNFGTFVAAERSERRYFDLHAREWKVSPARRNVRFIPSPVLRRAVNAEGRD